MSGTGGARVELAVPYGDGELRFSLPRANLAGVIEAGAGTACTPVGPDDVTGLKPPPPPARPRPRNRPRSGAPSRSRSARRASPSSRSAPPEPSSS